MTQEERDHWLAAVTKQAVSELMPQPLGDGRTAKKDSGYCEREGIDHAWEVLPIILTSLPSQSVRACTNCGKRQHMRHTEPTWE